MVAAGMLIVYKTGAIRVTPKFTRVLVGATIGVFGLMLVNLIAYLFHPGGLGLRDGGALAIIFSLICIVIAAFNLVLDFDIIEQGIKHGADEKFAWYASFGLMVTLIWLYLEFLRLLGYLRITDRSRTLAPSPFSRRGQAMCALTLWPAWPPARSWCQCGKRAAQVWPARRAVPPAWPCPDRRRRTSSPVRSACRATAGS